MESIPGLVSLTYIVTLAAVAPIIVGLLPRPRPPEVVILLLGGMILGPQILGVVSDTGDVNLIVELGLGFLFFVAGFETDLRVLRESAGRLALWSWGVSIVAALILAFLADRVGFVRAPVPVAIALTTTALGTLLPILKDNGVLRLPLGRNVVAAGTVGEFGPLLAISLFLGTTGLFGALMSLAVVGVIAAITALIPRGLSDNVREILDRGQTTSSQTMVRWTVVLLLVLLVVAMRFGLDIVIGAFAAGIVLRMNQGGDEQGVSDLGRKLEGLAFGFFVPVFFVASGITLDLHSIVENPSRLAVFFLAIVLIRGLPTFLLHRRAVPRLPDRLRLTLYTATGLPVIIAVTTIGLSSGVMLPQNAAALVGAGVLTVMIFPLVAELIARRSEAATARSEPEPADLT
jgi:Kef-type K+ transport system membrane component KefB